MHQTALRFPEVRHGTEAECSRQAKDRGAECQDVDDRARRAVDPMLEQGIEARTDGHRQTVTEAEIGQREADDPVDCPGMDSPVEQRVEHGFLCLHDRRGHAVKWRREMISALPRRNTSGRCPCPQKRACRARRRMNTRAPRHRRPSGYRRACRDRARRGTERRRPRPAEGIEEFLLEKRQDGLRTLRHGDASSATDAMMIRLSITIFFCKFVRYNKSPLTKK